MLAKVGPGGKMSYAEWIEARQPIRIIFDKLVCFVDKSQPGVILTELQPLKLWFTHDYGDYKQNSVGN